MLTSLGQPPTFSYDAESRLLTTAGVTYTYDGDGNRVKKSSGTLYWGASMAESDLTATASSWKDYIYFAGKRVARREAVDSKAHYYYSDHLGSSSVVTDEVGTMSPCTNSPTGYTTIPTGEEESYFYPYGGEMKLCDRKPQNYKFTGKERDTESGLDNFGARYDSSALGRFMTPDWAAKPTTVPYASFGDPQTLNLYSYVENSPINRADADGHAPWGYGTSWGPCGNDDFCQKNGKEAWKEASDDNAHGWVPGCSIAGYLCGGAQKPLTPKQIQKMFYKRLGKAFNTALQKVFGKDFSKVGTQTLANAPHLDTSKTLADLHQMGKGENAEARNRPDFSDPNQPSLAQNGTIFIPSEAVASGNLNRVSGDYAHELANLLDFQINRYSGAVGTEQNYVTPDIKNDYPDDADTGMTVEVTMFGKPQF